MQKKEIKSSQAQDDLLKNKSKQELGNDIKGYFAERDKTLRGGDGKVEDAKKLSGAEAEVKELLYNNSMNVVELSDDVEPMFNSIFLSAKRNKVRTDSGLLLATALMDGGAEVDYQEKQIVMACGPQVQQAVKGTEVVINFESLRVNLSDNMGQKVNKETEIKIPIITIDGNDYINVSERNLKYISKKVR